MEREWFFQSMGDIVGPITAAQMREEATSGVLFLETLVRKGRNGKWVAASNVKGLFVEGQAQSYQTSITTKAMAKCKTCGKEVSKTAPTCPNCGEQNPGMRIRCPKCHKMNVIKEKKGFGIGKAAIGCIALGPIGLLGGMIGRKEMELVCQECGKRWS